MAALWGLEIDNMIVDISGAELPALDGSAAEFIRLLKSAGLEEQPALREYIKITEKEEIKESDSSLSVFPDESFRVSYLIDYKISSIGREVFDMDPGRDSFEKEIAPARTFCLKSEAEALLRAGLGKGATYENTLVLDDDGPVGTTLRFPNEPVRHKVLDLIGDFYMLGKPIIGRVAAERSGHSLNAKMVRRIYEKYVANKKKSFE
jgi:UDP-3-O-acyl N-acetylglucosamine deacetylase